MTCQTIVGHFILGMAVHAPTHGHPDKLFCGRFFALPNVSVTRLTIDLSKNDVTPMGKKDMIRLSVDSLPGDFIPLFFKLPDLLFLRTLGNRFFMALQTDRNVRHSREDLGLIKPVTGVTLKPLFPMFLMIEGNWLIGS